MKPNAPRGRQQADIFRSQLAMELLLTVLAAATALLFLRVAVASLAVGDGVWSGATVIRITDPLVLPFALLPGGERTLIGNATLAELTPAALAVAVPLFAFSRRRR